MSSNSVGKQRSFSLCVLFCVMFIFPRTGAGQDVVVGTPDKFVESKDEKESRLFMQSALSKELLAKFATRVFTPPVHNTVKTERTSLGPIKFDETTGERIEAKLSFLKPQETFTVEIPSFKRQASEKLEFELTFKATIAASATGVYYPHVPRSTIPIDGSADGTIAITVKAHCVATLQKKNETGLVEVTIEPKTKVEVGEIRLSKFKINKIGQFDGDAAKILTTLLDGIVKAEVQKLKPVLENEVTKEIEKATRKIEVNEVLLELILPESKTSTPKSK